MENREQWQSLKKFWTWMYWIAVGNGFLVAFVLLMTKLNKTSLLAAGLAVFNILLSNYWIMVCEKKLEDE